MHVTPCFANRNLVVRSAMRPTLAKDSSPDVVLDWLHDQGWSIDHTSQGGEWIVVSTRGTQQLRTTGKSLEEAWLRATEQASLCDDTCVAAK